MPESRARVSIGSNQSHLSVRSAPMAAPPSTLCCSRLFPPRPNRSFLPVISSSSASGGGVRLHDPPEDRRYPSSSNLEIIGDRHSILSQFESLKRPYTPYPVIGWNCHVETIFAAFFRSLPQVALRRECLRTRDDGAVALDWVLGDEEQLPAESPVLILLPGLTGGSSDTYVRHMLVRARSKGWRVVVFNSRGCANSPVTTPQFYSSSFTEDLSQVVNHVSACYPKSKIYAAGWSVGANILVSYLGQESHRCPLSGAVSLCNPFNLVIEDENFREGFNNIYDKSLARAFRKIFKKHALLFQGIRGEYNIAKAANARSVREFDEGLTCVSFGFKSVDDYYSNSNSSDSIEYVQTPLLCIQAANDPLAPSRGIPRGEIKENPHCLLIVTPQGGHLGWIAGDGAPLGAPWTDAVVMEFLEHLNEKNVKGTTNCIQPNGIRQPSAISVP